MFLELVEERICFSNRLISYYWTVALTQYMLPKQLFCYQRQALSRSIAYLVYAVLNLIESIFINDV